MPQDTKKQKGRLWHEDDPRVYLKAAWICHELLKIPFHKQKEKYKELASSQPFNQEQLHRLTRSYYKQVKLNESTWKPEIINKLQG